MYALINSKNIVENIIEWDGETPYETPEELTAIFSPIGTKIGALYANGEFLNPNESFVETPLNLQAQYALDSITGPRGAVIRCVIAGISVPANWTSYIFSLRAIANGTDKESTQLPSPPAYPPNT